MGFVEMIDSETAKELLRHGISIEKFIDLCLEDMIYGRAYFKIVDGDIEVIKHKEDKS